MCVHEGGSRSRACLGEFSRKKSAALSAQVRACDKTHRGSAASYAPASGTVATNTTRQMINESADLGEKKKKKVPKTVPLMCSIDCAHKANATCSRGTKKIQPPPKKPLRSGCGRPAFLLRCAAVLPQLWAPLAITAAQRSE